MMDRVVPGGVATDLAPGSNHERRAASRGILEKARPHVFKVAVNVHFSSATALWATPQSFFDACNRIFSFTLDVCATAENAKCERFYTEADDGLAQEWVGTCWMNPPYGRTIGKWMRKAWESAQKGATVVCLVPARVDTKWWHDYAARGQVTFCADGSSLGMLGAVPHSRLLWSSSVSLSLAKSYSASNAMECLPPSAHTQRSVAIAVRSACTGRIAGLGGFYETKGHPTIKQGQAYRLSEQSRDRC
jgi:phage N-6-adenine-methyltransferase